MHKIQMQELDDEQTQKGDFNRHKYSKQRRSPFKEELQPWTKTMKTRSEQNTMDPSLTYYKVDRPGVVNKFLATVKTATNWRAKKKRNKMSLCDDHTFCLDQTISKDPYHYDMETTLKHKQKATISNEGIIHMNNDQRQIFTRESSMRNKIMYEYNNNNNLTKNTLILNTTDNERPCVSSEQDYRFRSNFHKLLKLRDKIRQKKLSIIERNSDRQYCDIQKLHKNIFIGSQKRVNIPIMTLDQFNVSERSRSYGKSWKQPSKNCFLITYKFTKQKSKQREQRLQRNRLDSKVADVHKLVNTIKQKGIDCSKMLMHPRIRLEQWLPSKDRHLPN